MCYFDEPPKEHEFSAFCIICIPDFSINTCRRLGKGRQLRSLSWIGTAVFWYAANEVNKYETQLVRFQQLSALIYTAAYGLHSLSFQQTVRNYHLLQNQIVFLSSKTAFNIVKSEDEWRCNNIKAKCLFPQNWNKCSTRRKLDKKYGTFKSYPSKLFFEHLVLFTKKKPYILGLWGALLKYRSPTLWSRNKWGSSKTISANNKTRQLKSNVRYNYRSIFKKAS